MASFGYHVNQSELTNFAIQAKLDNKLHLKPYLYGKKTIFVHEFGR